MTTKTLAFEREYDFWRALDKAIDRDDMEAAAILVQDQMVAWQEQLERKMDRLTHNGCQTVH